MRVVSRGKQGRSVVVAVAVIAGIVIIVGAVLSLAAFIDHKLNQSAEQQVVTFTEQAASNVVDRIDMTESAIGAFTIQSDNPAQVIFALQALQNRNGFSSVSFARMDGEGRSADGSVFSTSELSQPETAIKQEMESYSDTYVNDEGMRVRLAQKPLYIENVQVGALYVQVPLAMFTVPDYLDIFDGRGYFMLFEVDSGEILVPPANETKTPISGNTSLYDFLETASTYVEASQSDGEKGTNESFAFHTRQENSLQDLRGMVNSGNTGLITSSVDGKASYVCVAPVSQGHWYVCSVVPVANVRAEAAVVTTTFQVVFGIVIVCLLVMGFLIFFSYRRRMRERNVAMMSQLYKALSGSVELAVNLYSPVDKQVTRIVAKAANIIGYPLDDFLKDRRLADTIKLSKDGIALFDRIRTGDVRGLEQGEFSFRSPRTGAVRWVSYTVNPLVFDEKPQLLIVLRDTTADKAIQLSMKDAMDAAEAANEAKSEFLSRMSHEIRTPMNVIIGMLQIAEGNVEDPDKMRSSLAKIGLASDHLLGLINDVLDISKIENGKMTLASEAFRLDEMLKHVESAIRPQYEQRNQTFTVQVSEGADEVLMGDAIRLQQLILNLLSNAMKYTSEGGHVLLSATVAPGAVAGYRQITLSVTDDGIGMSEEFQKSLFEPFMMEGRSREQGTGLGMPIVKNIVTMMGGSIFVKSAVNEGTTFKVVINLKTTSAAALAPSSPFEPVDIAKLEGLRVLVAEDNDLNAEIARELLSTAGLVVDRAIDGQETCDLFEASPVGFYDVILMDVQMPVLNGCDATRRIRSLDRPDAYDVPIIAMSANAFSEDVNASLESGMNAHLSKPIDIQCVLSTIAEFVRKRREGGRENVPTM